jgi:CCR4-NOT transcription complex subunit 6
VQSDHYEDFFQPEMQKAGYTAVYKMKTAALYTGSTYTIDGCATFFRTDRFTLVKKYEVEFNKAALSLSEALSAANQKKAALNRLLKVSLRHTRFCTHVFLVLAVTISHGYVCTK